MDPMESHDRDQLFAAIREVAAVHFRYYEALIEEGFTPTEALSITATVAAETFRSAEGRGDDWR